jgi:alkylation response protein AidB-like acyl-CoA dehydrogenase
VRNLDEEYVALVRRTVEDEDFFGRADRNDRESRYPAENIAALKSIGVPSMAVARIWGGPEHSLATQARVVEAIAYGDPSTAACVNMHWVVADIIADHAGADESAADLLRDCARNQAMFAGGASIPADEIDARRAGARFKRVEGGWLGSGRVGYATNSEGASYVGTVAAVVDEEGEPVGRTILILNPPLDSPGIRVLHDWSAMGLRATATNTIEIEDAFVDPRYAYEIDLDSLKPGLEGGRGEVPGYSARKARSQISKGAMWLGHCQHIYDLMVEFMRKRTGGTAVLVKGSPVGTRAEAAWAQATLGDMRHWIESGRLVVYGTIDAISDESMDPVERADRMLLAMYHQRRMCEEVARDVFRLAGAHGLVTARPFERMYRDLVGYIATAYKAPELLEHYGRAGLGLVFALNASGG